MKSRGIYFLDMSEEQLNASMDAEGAEESLVEQQQVASEAEEELVTDEKLETISGGIIIEEPQLGAPYHYIPHSDSITDDKFTKYSPF